MHTNTYLTKTTIPVLPVNLSALLGRKRIMMGAEDVIKPLLDLTAEVVNAINTDQAGVGEVRS